MATLTKDNAEVGMGITLHSWTDSNPYTIIRISGQRIYIQADKVVQLTAPQHVPGGFSGVCINNREIKYDISPDPAGYKTCLYPKKDGTYYNEKKPVTIGRYYFYDYNF